MRNLLDLVARYTALAETTMSEDLFLQKAKDHEIVLDDPADDEVDNLDKASPAKRKKIMKDVERDMHEARQTHKGAEWKKPSTLADYANEIISNMKQAGRIAQNNPQYRPSWNPDGLPDARLSKSFVQSRKWKAALALINKDVVKIVAGSIESGDIALLPGQNFPDA